MTKYAINCLAQSAIFQRNSCYLKRSIDLFFAFIGLIVCGPLIALIALLVWLDSSGNPFFIQERVGRQGKLFKLLKIRTLYVEHFGIVPNEEAPRPYRITRMGKYLRISKLDELPQLLNILAGQMSIVGPRPDIPEQSCHYSAFQQQRLSVKPGLTGIAQISGNTLLSWPERIVLDIWYIQNWSCLLDFKIMVLTWLTIIRGDSLNYDYFGLRSRLLLSENNEVAIKLAKE